MNEEISEKDRFKSNGTIEFIIENFGKFSKENVGAWRCSEPIFIRGLLWRILAQIGEEESEKTLCFYLQCADEESDTLWTCAATATLGIMAQYGQKADYAMKFSGETFRCNDQNMGIEHFKKLKDLMDPRNGWYHPECNSIFLNAHLEVEAPRGMDIQKLANPDSVNVNKVPVKVNKHLLAAHSTYFASLFFNKKFIEGREGKFDIKLNSSENVETFERMVATMYPENRPLDDECVAAVLGLANRFLLHNVEKICRQFLLCDSKLSPIVKFSIGSKFGFEAKYKKRFLNQIARNDFEGDLFFENAKIICQLDAEDRKAIENRHAEIFSAGFFGQTVEMMREVERRMKKLEGERPGVRCTPLSRPKLVPRFEPY